MKRWIVGFLACFVMMCTAVIAAQADSEFFYANYDEMVLAVGQSEKLRMSFDGADAAIRKAGFTFESSNKKAATVNKTGTVKAVGAGNSTIRVISKYDEGEYIDIPVTVYQPIKKITASISKQEIENGETVQIDWKLQPANATYQKVQFESNRKVVATVDEHGVVTGVGKGSAVISVISEDGLAKATVSIKVTQRPEKIEVTAKSNACTVGKTLQLKCSVLPKNADNHKITWVSDNEEIATVSASGKVTARKAGEVIISAISAADEKVKGSFALTCVQPVKAITFDEDCYYVLLNESIRLNPVVLPDSATDKTVKYKSSNSHICVVDDNGVVTAVGSGKTAITVTACDGSKRSTRVSIQVITPVTGVSYAKDGVRVGVNYHTTVTVNIEPVKATNKNMVWSSSDESIAVVSGTDNRVRISGRAWGRTTITGITEDGGYTVTFHVNVGSLRNAIKVVAVDIRYDRPYLTLKNVSNMTISRVYYEMYGLDSNGERVELSTKPDKTILLGEYGYLMPGERTTHGNFYFINYRKDNRFWDLRKLYLAITGFDTEDGYYDTNGALNYTYRINRENYQYIPSK